MDKPRLQESRRGKKRVMGRGNVVIKIYNLGRLSSEVFIPYLKDYSIKLSSSEMGRVKNG